MTIKLTDTFTTTHKVIPQEQCDKICFNIVKAIYKELNDKIESDSIQNFSTGSNIFDSFKLRNLAIVAGYTPGYIETNKQIRSRLKIIMAEHGLFEIDSENHTVFRFIIKLSKSHLSVEFFKRKAYVINEEMALTILNSRDEHNVFPIPMLKKIIEDRVRSQLNSNGMNNITVEEMTDILETEDFKITDNWIIDIMSRLFSSLGYKVEIIEPHDEILMNTSTVIRIKFN